MFGDLELIDMFQPDSLPSSPDATQGMRVCKSPASAEETGRGGMEDDGREETARGETKDVRARQRDADSNDDANQRKKGLSVEAQDMPDNSQRDERGGDVVTSQQKVDKPMDQHVLQAGEEMDPGERNEEERERRESESERTKDEDRMRGKERSQTGTIKAKEGERQEVPEKRHTHVDQVGEDTPATPITDPGHGGKGTHRRPAAEADSAGVGMVIGRTHDDVVVVNGVEPGGPADQAGVRRGALLLAVNGTSVSGLRTAAIHELIKGPVGSTLQLTIEYSPLPIASPSSDWLGSMVRSAAGQSNVVNDVTKSPTCVTVTVTRAKLTPSTPAADSATRSSAPLRRQPIAMAELASQEEAWHGVLFITTPQKSRKSAYSAGDTDLERPLPMVPTVAAAESDAALGVDAAASAQLSATPEVACVSEKAELQTASREGGAEQVKKTTSPANDALPSATHQTHPCTLQRGASDTSVEERAAARKDSGGLELPEASDESVEVGPSAVGKAVYLDLCCDLIGGDEVGDNDWDRVFDLREELWLASYSEFKEDSDSAVPVNLAGIALGSRGPSSPAGADSALSVQEAGPVMEVVTANGAK